MEVLADPSLRFLGILGKGGQAGEDRATSNDDIVPVCKLTETPFTKDVEGGFEIFEVRSHRGFAVCATLLFWEREDVVRIEFLLALDLARLGEASGRGCSEDVNQADERVVQNWVLPVGGEETTEFGF